MQFVNLGATWSIARVEVVGVAPIGGLHDLADCCDYVDVLRLAFRSKGEPQHAFKQGETMHHFMLPPPPHVYEICTLLPYAA